MDFRLREIAGKAAGTYFIVTDNSATTEISQTSNLRLLPINVPGGVTNTIVYFEKGNKDGLMSVFGKGLRKEEKQGNYSIKSALEMLDAGPLAVINLRAFDDDADVVDVANMGANNSESDYATVPYRQLFDTNGFWVAKGKNLPATLSTENLLNFGCIGKGVRSIFVTVATDIKSLTNEGNKTLTDTTLEIEEYPGLNPEMLVKETFVDVWIFDNAFNYESNLNPFYGQFFNQAGLIDANSLNSLSKVNAAGFNRKITGSLIPYLKNESNEDISIDTLMNQLYAETGIIAFLNDDVLEVEDPKVINTAGIGMYGEDGNLEEDGIMLSYRVQPSNADIIDLTVLSPDTIKPITKPTRINSVKVSPDVELAENQCLGVFEHGLRGGAMMHDGNEITNIKLLEVASVPTQNIDFNYTLNNASQLTYFSVDTTWVGEITVYKRTNSSLPWTKYGTYQTGIDYFVEGDGEYRLFPSTSLSIPSLPIYKLTGETVEEAGTWQGFTNYMDYTPCIYTFKTAIGESMIFTPRPYENPLSKLYPQVLYGYTPRAEQFTNGTPARQNEILDLLISDWMIKGLKNFGGIRYIIDGFKSFVEGGYKSQFGQLCSDLDDCNVFVRAITNEIFIEDLNKSTNPLFKQQPNGVLDLANYLEVGGNSVYSTNFLNKSTVGAEYVFTFGSGKVVGPNVEVVAPAISNEFIRKTFPWDVVANSTGIINGISSIELNPDDNERLAMEKFRCNPIIKKGSNFVIFGNYTNQLGNGSLSQIHNSEALAYIKQSLLDMSKDESFKKGTYDDYIRLETQVTSFMDSLVQQGVIQANPEVICNFNNNTTEIQKAKIKLVEISFAFVDSLDKVVFALNLN